MRISHEIVINQNREGVWRVFDHPEKVKKWQPALKKLEPQSGQWRQTGAVTRLTYEENGREVVIIETITGRDAPAGFSGEYHGSQAVSKISNKFTVLDYNKTKWTLDCEFVFKGLMLKLLSLLMKGTIRKRIERDLIRFKKLAESQM